MKTITLLILIGLTLIGAITMARGHEDWFINRDAFSKSLVDVGELGARFGIPYSFTRSGKVVYTDGFETSLAPWTIITGAGYGTVERDTAISFRGAYSAKFTPAVDGVQRAQIDKVIPFILSGRVGLEVVFSGEAQANNVYFKIGIRKDEIYYTFRFKVIMGDATLYIQTGATTWTLIADLVGNMSRGAGHFYLAKMVVDTDTLTYHSVRINNNVYDVSGTSGYNFASALPDMMLIGLDVIDTDADQGIVRFDDVTVTIDEP